MVPQELLLRPYLTGGVDVGVLQSYLMALQEHIAYVQEAGRMLGIADEHLWSHDSSKFEAEEFPHYARQHHGDKSDPIGYARAWLHHLHANPHHWQHWIFPLGYPDESGTIESGVMEMPERYALEMVADWMGAGRAYNGSWDMTDWLQRSIPTITLHSRTAEFVRGVLSNQGYAEVVANVTFLVRF